jgi:hypothetical protein
MRGASREPTRSHYPSLARVKPGPPGTRPGDPRRPVAHSLPGPRAPLRTRGPSAPGRGSPSPRGAPHRGHHSRRAFPGHSGDRQPPHGRRSGCSARVGDGPTHSAPPRVRGSSVPGRGPCGLPGTRPAGVRWTSRAVGRVLSRVLVAGDAVTVIHLGWPLPTTSSALPACSGGPPSNARCLGLLRMGFTEPTWSPRSLVVSYTTVSPLPRSLARPGRSVFCGTVPRVAPGGCWPPSCPSEPGPSSAVVAHRRDRPPDSSAASVGVSATRTRRPPRRRARRRGRAAPTGGTRARRGDP